MRSLRLLGLAAILVNSPVTLADISVTIDSSSDRGTWEGWGTSLAWWAAAFGDRDDLADLFFTLDTYQFSGQSLPGLGFNIIRYNAGACTWTTANGESMVVSPNMIPSRQMEGYWLNWDSTDPASSSWDWSVDATQREAVQKAIERGVDQVELFSNSPMWWMCKNHNPSGSSDGSENIQSWNLENHAIYMANVAQHFRDNFNVEFVSVDPFNEPSASWWKADGTQEGCHFDISTQATVIQYLDSHLNSRGLSTYISASDESLYDQAVTTLENIGADAISRIGRINVHGYQGGGGRRDTLHEMATNAGRVVWNSEYGDGTGDGSELVSNLMLDFRWLLQTAWVYWQVLDGSGWGLIVADNDAGSIDGVNQKYFVLAQFSRHIRPGMRILDGGGDNVVAAYDSSNSKLIVVAVNWDTAQNISFDLSGFSQPPADGTAVANWRTQFSGGDKYTEYPDDTQISGTSFQAYFDANSVQTFEVSGVQL